MVPVPNTGQITFNYSILPFTKSCKGFLHKDAQSLYSQEIVKQMEAGKRSDVIKLDVRDSTMKPLHAKWIVKYHDYIRSKPHHY